MQLTSVKNPFLQDVRRALREGRATEDGLIAVEGPHLVEELSGGAWRLKKVIATEGARSRYSGLLARTEAEIVEIPSKTFASLTATEAPQEILALAAAPVYTWEEVVGGLGTVVVLDGMQDPGNAGAIVRSAEAFGASAIVLTTGSAHVANGKFLRASAGSIFRLPYLENQGAEALARLARLRLFSLSAHRGAAIGDADLRAPFALIVGSEAHGISRELAAASESLHIPTSRVESLNAAAAAAIALYEAARQRKTA